MPVGKPLPPGETAQGGPLKRELGERHIRLMALGACIGVGLFLGSAKAIEMAVEAGQMSISMLQRVLRVGYGRAGRLIDEMARRSIISGNEGTKPRKTLITREEYRQLFEDDVPF